MSEEKLISIIVPVYNIKDYVSKCIESIMGQTYHNLEIILVDDGSTDGSGEICDRYAEYDRRIDVIHRENGGLSEARNCALDRVRGDLIAFVDGDDWIHPQMCELMLGVMEQRRADIVTCRLERENADFAKHRYTKSDLDARVLTGTESLSNIGIPSVVAWNKLYRKEIFDNIRYPKGRLHEDEYVIHRIFYKCNRVAVIGQPLYFYTIRDGSIVMQMTPQRINHALEALADRVRFSDEHNWSEVMPAVVEQYCDYCIGIYKDIRSGRYESIDASYLDILWRSERDMLERYRDTDIDEKYRRFAKSPDEYDKYLSRNARIDRYKNLLRKVADRITGLFGIRTRQT